VLVDQDEAHRPQPELLDAGDDLGRRFHLLIRVQPLTLDEPRRSEAQTLAHVTASLVDTVVILRRGPMPAGRGRRGTCLPFARTVVIAARGQRLETRVPGA
jgi:hypothetical protein